MESKYNGRLIIPCAGFGTRVNMSPDQSKELLEYNGKPLIEFSLNIAKQYNLNPLIVTRKEKKDLIQYCQNNNLDYMVLNNPTREWAHTVLKTVDEWDLYNYLILPDTQWYNTDIITNMHRDMQLGANASFGVFSVPDPHNWGIINNYRIQDKPSRGLFDAGAAAWGLIGFRKGYGEELFSSLDLRRDATHLKNVSFQTVVGFHDLTRKPN